MRQIFPAGVSRVLSEGHPRRRRWFVDRPLWVNFLTTVYEGAANHINDLSYRNTSVSYKCSASMVSDMYASPLIRELSTVIGPLPYIDQNISDKYPSIGIPVPVLTAFKDMFAVSQVSVSRLHVSTKCQNECGSPHGMYLCLGISDHFDAPAAGRDTSRLRYSCDHTAPTSED